MNKYLKALKHMENCIFNVRDNDKLSKETRVGVIRIFINQIEGIRTVAVNDDTIVFNDYLSVDNAIEELKSRAELIISRLQLFKG